MKKYESPEVERIDFAALQQIATFNLGPVGKSGGTGGDHLDKSEYLGGDNSDIVSP